MAESSKSTGDRLDALEADLVILKAVLAKRFTSPWVHPEDEHRHEMARAGENAAASRARTDADEPRLAGTEVGADREARQQDFALAAANQEAAAAGESGVRDGIVTGQAVGVVPGSGPGESSEQTKEDLLHEAQRLGIEGRSSMSKEELAVAIAEYHGKP